MDGYLNHQFNSNQEFLNNWSIMFGKASDTIAHTATYYCMPLA